MYRIKELMKLNEPLYHTDDLGRLWGITNRNTLTVTIHRYIRQGILTPVQRGLYASRPLDQVPSDVLGSSLIYSYCYLSTETVLIRAGVIFQEVDAYTFVAGASKRLHSGTSVFHVRRLAPEYLYQPTGISQIDGVLTANAQRAAADMLYFNPHYYFDAPDKLDWSEVHRIEKEVGYDCK